jgi:hypothetical protein
MNGDEPKNAVHVQKIVEERLAALGGSPGTEETATVEWRGQQKHIPVIAMPIDLLSYNPGTHRIRAQRSIVITIRGYSIKACVLSVPNETSSRPLRSTAPN